MREFEGRTLLIATKHAKELVMAPILETALGVKCMVAKGFDTDCLGTFCGQIEREDDAIRTARKKCRQAMMIYDCDLAVSSEGTFGLHPLHAFCYADEELVLLVDSKNNNEISAVTLSTNTNFSGESVEDLSQLLNFAERANFPSHGLILKKSKDSHSTAVKGIQDPVMLTTKFKSLCDRYGSVYVQTDMRAMYNPLRMVAIKHSTEKLVNKIKSRCPDCKTPGFGATATQAGLPCELCGLPTLSPLAYIHKCSKCGFEYEERYPNQIQYEEPRHCGYCNP